MFYDLDNGDDDCGTPWQDMAGVVADADNNNNDDDVSILRNPPCPRHIFTVKYRTQLIHVCMSKTYNLQPIQY